MRVVPCVVILAVGLGLPGCALFKKQQPPAPSQAAADPLFPRPDGPNPSTGKEERAAPNTVIPTSTASGLLAGQVIDSFGNPVKDAYILVTFPPSDGKACKKPLDVAANSQGYFTISGLEPGKHFQLIARARDGNRMMAGTVWTTPPNPRVLIRISEDFVSKGTPPLPPPPAWPGAGDKTVPTQADNPPIKAAIPPITAPSADQGWSPGQAPAAVRGDAGQSGPADEGQRFDNEPRSAHPDRIAEGNGKGLINTAPPVIIPGPQVRGPFSSSGDAPFPAQTLPAGRVPSCVLTGNQLVNLALNDLDGRPWEFRQRTGKVVLLDFWSTTCVPCVQTIPHLNALQYKYRNSGLQVVGIAYEGDGSAERQRTKVDDFCQVKRVGYKILLGGGSSCPVLTQFRVRGLPTLVLLDANGWILWKHVGALDAQSQHDLEMRIRLRLGYDDR